jgi:hypothetical protein
VASALTRVHRDHLLALARADGAPGTREARQELTAHGLTWSGRYIKAQNAAANGRMAELGRLPAMFLAPTVTKNPRPSAAGLAAIKRNRKR